jgi:serine/threonine-protein kinase
VTIELRDRLQAMFGDAYVIERELAPGGMSRLFLAREASLDRDVVIKLLPPETASEVSATRFQREVQFAAKLQHPHILPILTTGTSGDLFYYIMPYVQGESLRQRLEHGERFPIPEALRVLREIADALALAHSRGIVHRDIKPANILLQEGHAVVTDFGIARAVEASRLDGATTAERLTATGVGIGTLGYMAPEQLAGERDLDARADVYALAVVAYEMFAGQPPFSRSTAQALVAAHLTEPPPPLATVAPEVPPAISLVITKALAKSPEDRYRTAAEFRDALDVQVTAAFAVMPRRRRPRKTALLVFAAVSAILVTAAAIYARLLAPKLDPNYVLIVPFDVRNADTSLREGMVTVLHESMNGQGWVRTVPPSRFVRTWHERPDELTAAQLGKRMGAAVAVFGSAVGTGNDSLVLSASILDVARSRQLGTRVAISGPKEELPRLANGLARALLKELNRWKPLGAHPTTWLEETTLPALQAFLVGEQFYRRSAWDSATAYYERAIDADTSFALAYRHAGLVVGWRRSTADSLSRAYLRTAGRFNRGLPRRDSLLIVADSLRATLTAFESDTGYFSSVRRLFRILQTARDSFPTDPEIWFALGDAYWHFGDGPGLSVEEDTILAAFDRSIALDSGFTPAYIHPIEVRLTRDGREAGLRYADRYLALEPIDEEADGIRILASLLRGADVSGTTAEVLDTLNAPALQTAWLIARRWPDSAETGITLLRLPVKGRRGEAFLITDPGFRRVLTARELAYRGHLKQAYETIGTNIGALEAETFGLLAMMGAIPADTASAVFARWLHDTSINFSSALPWWAAKGDTLSLRIVLARADSQLALANNSVQHRNWLYRAAAVRAYLALAQRSGDAAARFAELPDTLCLGCYADRLTKARVLDSLGRHAEAEAALRERPHNLLTPLEIVVAHQRAIIAEKIGHYEVAARSYSLVARAWLLGDDGARAQAARAATIAAQLGGDQPQRGRRADR